MAMSEPAPEAVSAAAPARPVPVFHIVWHMMRGAVAGKVLGFLREICTAKFLGISILADALRTATVAVLVPVMMLTNHVLPAVMIPTFRTWEESGRAPATLTSLLAVLFAAASLIAATLFVYAEAWVSLLVPGFDAEARAHTIALVRVMLLATPMFMVSTVILCAEVALGCCRIGPLQQVFANTSIIVGLLIFAVTGEPLVIAWSFAVAFVLLAVFGLRHLHGLGMIDRRGLSFGAGLRAIGDLGRRGGLLFLTPMILGLLMVIERVVASELGAGAVAAVEYARAISMTSVVLLGVPVGMAVLSQDYRDDAAKARTHFRRLAPFSLAFGVPGAVVLYVLAPDIVAVLLERGVFQAEATAVTALILAGFAFGFWADLLHELLVKMLNAQGRNNTAMLAMGVGIAAQVLFLVLAVPTLGLVGLGLAAALRPTVTVVVSALLLGFTRELFGFVVRFAPLGVVAGGLATAADPLAQSWLKLIVVGAVLTPITVGYTLAVSGEARSLARRMLAAARARLSRRGEHALGDH